jgi:hypothetical protein
MLFYLIYKKSMIFSKHMQHLTVGSDQQNIGSYIVHVDSEKWLKDVKVVGWGLLLS